MKPNPLRILCLCLSLSFGAAAQARADAPLNIIYILADDLGYGDVGVYGQEKLETPHIDRLAADGMLFTDHYSGSTVCAPSRSALMTGQHTGRTPIRHNSKGPQGGQLPLPADAVTVAEILKEVGYTTGAFGKWGLGYTGTEGDPSVQGIDVFVGYKDQVNAHSYYPEHIWKNNEKLILNKDGKRRVYAQDVIHQHSLEFIRENQDQPFFCYIPTALPHAELVAPEAIMERYRGRFGTETPYTGRESGPDTYVAQPEPRAAFAAMIQILDDQVGEIRALVEELGIADRTLIIFTSDNGPHDAGGGDPEYFDGNGPFRGIKRDLYEGGIRVPMIAWAPGRVEAGSRTNHISAFWDVLPTLAELANAPVPAGIDGISFAPTLLQQGEQAEHRYLYWGFLGGGGKIAVRMGKWKAVQLSVIRDPDGPWELYDLSTDPSETTDLAGAYPAVIAQARKFAAEAHTRPFYDRFNFLPGDEAPPPSFLYQKGPLKLSETALQDAIGGFTLAQLPDPQPKNQTTLKAGSTPLIQRMWAIALDDMERNIVTNELGNYFAAGTRYTDRVYTRDIAFAGVLGANQLYPSVMLDSLKLTRVRRLELGYQVSRDHVVPEIDAPWEVIAESDKEIMAQYKTNSYTRRTDDVVWMWATHDLFTLHPEMADWPWFYENGQQFFNEFYAPWFDPSDGLYRGQPVYHDIGNSAYPKDMTKADCVLVKSTATNALYYRGMLAMAEAAEKCGRPQREQRAWLSRAESLKRAIQKELTNEDGTLAYFKDRHGKLLTNRSILGTSLPVILGVIEGEAAQAAYAGYPETDLGVPNFFPFIPGNQGPHNMAAWPFCMSFYFWGKEVATGESFAAYNAALLGRSLGTKMAHAPEVRESDGEDWGEGLGSFHEKIKLPSGLIDGSGHQLWSAAAFLNVCLRADLVNQ